MDKKIIQLVGVRMEQLSTSEGRKKAQRIFSCNMDKLLKIDSTGCAPQKWVTLQPAHPSRTEDTSQQYSEASALPQG
jgi:hypothetical protein